MRTESVAVPLYSMLVLVLVAGGCATTTGGSQLENTVYATHQTVRKLDRNLSASVSKLNETAVDLAVRIDETDRQSQGLQSLVEENQVKLCCPRSRGEEVAQRALIFLRCPLGIYLSAHPVDVLDRYRHVVQQRLARHAVVAVRVVRRNAALVPPEDVDPCPVYAMGELRVGKQRVGSAGGGPTRQGHRQPPARAQ